MTRQGGWTVWAVAKRNSKLSYISRGTTRLEKTQIRWFSWKSGREAGPHEQRPKLLKWELEIDSRQPRELLKRAEWQPKKSQLLFLRRCWGGEMLMMRWEPLCHHRIVRQQHWVLKNLLSGRSIYSSPLISASEVWEQGQKIDGQHDTYTIFGPSLLISSQPDLHTMNRVYNHYNYFVIGEDE